MSALIRMQCCVCGDVVERDDPDGYSLQIQKVREYLSGDGPGPRAVSPQDNSSSGRGNTRSSAQCFVIPVLPRSHHFSRGEA